MHVREILIGFLVFSFVITMAQSPFPPLSPKSKVVQQIGYTTVTINYERPSARERVIFGGLVPYGKVWKTGAGDPTTIGFSDTVFIQHKRVVPGTYSLYSIPGEQMWTIILNRDTVRSYQEEHDVLRFEVKPQPSNRFYESLTIYVDVVPNDGRLYISWENTQVGFDILTNTDQTLSAKLKQALSTSLSEEPSLYASGAEYYYLLNRHLETGLALIDKAISLDTRSWFYSLKVNLLEKLGRHADAIEVLKTNMAYVSTNPEKWTKDQLQGVIDEQTQRLEQLRNKQKQTSKTTSHKQAAAMIYVLQLIYIKEGQENVFHQFEDVVIPIISKYNGRLLLRIRPDNQSFIEHSIEKPYEVHLVEFSTQQDFEKFMLDDERKKFLHLKEKSIKSSVLIQGSKL